MRITDALTGEHGALVALFDRLDRDLHAGATAAEVREQAALLAAALVSHAHLEDELLFERMGGAGGSPALLETMAGDHAAIAACLSRAQGTADAGEARDELRAAVVMARDHFALEERMVFPVAATLLGAALLEELGARWAERRGVWLEAGAAG